LPETGQRVGIDVGLKTFATFSTGEEIADQRFFRCEERALAKVQRAHRKLEKGTPARAKHRHVVARVHERIAWRRGDFTHQHSRRIVNQFDLIAVEDLSVNRMVHNHCLAKSIHDAAWSQFADLLSYKAAWAGRSYVAVNPAYTSQDCSRCGHRKTDLTLADRTYACPCCGVALDRDLNASLNILGVGLHTLGLAPRSSRIYAGEYSPVLRYTPFSLPHDVDFVVFGDATDTWSYSITLPFIFLLDPRCSGLSTWPRLTQLSAGHTSSLELQP
jgi:putative transposase